MTAIRTDMGHTRCPGCGYDLTGLPEGHLCPECGFDGRPEEMQRRVEAWYATRAGLLLVDPPPMTLALLCTPSIKRIATRRTLALFALSAAPLVVTVFALSSIGLGTTWERWWESPDRPGERRDVDQTRSEMLTFGGRPQPAALPTGPYGQRIYFAKAIRRWLVWSPHTPRDQDLARAGWVLFWGLNGRAAALMTFLMVGRGRAIAQKRAAFPWPALVWFTVPLVAGGAVSVGIMLLKALADLELFSADVELVNDTLFLGAIALTLTWQFRQMSVAAGTIRDTSRGLSLLCWLIGVGFLAPIMEWFTLFSIEGLVDVLKHRLI